ncbi:MAG: MFS transporter [Theionarchaea archaeon]|nr:MFS transporter [Theionarchaea archaeon]
MSLYEANIQKMYIFKFLLNLHFVAGVLVPFYLDWGKIGFTQIMILQSFFVFSIFLLEVPTGAVADHFGRKTSLILSGAAVSSGALIYSSIPHFSIFLLGEFFWALGYALLSGADEALAYDSLKMMKSEHKSKKIFGRFTSFELAALMVGAPLGSIIASTVGLRYTMMFMSVPFFGSFLLAFTFTEPERTTKESQKYFETLINGVKYFKNHKILKILAFDKISTHTLIFLIIWVYQPLLKQLGVPIIYFGFIHTAIMGVEIVFMNNFEKLEIIFGSKKRYLVLSALIAGTSFVLLGINTYIPLTLALLFIVGGFGLSRYVLFQSYMNKYIESDVRATVISTVSMIDRFVRALLYPLVGLLVEWSLSYAIIVVGAAIILFALLSGVEEEHLID